jgi:hypothetical protein
VQRAVSLAVIAALLSPLLFVQVDGNSAWLRVALDGSHVPIFAGVAMLLAADLRLRQPSAPDGRMYLLAFALAFGLGAVIEYLQSLTGRPASAFDLTSNAAGAAIGIGLLALREGAAGRRPLAGRARPVFVCAMIVGLVFASWRPLEAARAYVDRAGRFPVLAAFDAPRDLYFVTTQGLAAEIVPLPARWAAAPGEGALRIRYATDRSPAVQITEPSPDWQGFRTIALDITNASDVELHLVLRILDAKHDWSHEDRFNHRLTIPAATRSTIRVPLEAVRSAPARRPMDLAHIANVMIFGHDPAAGGDLYLSRLWLE